MAGCAGFYEARCVMTGCTVVGHCAAEDQQDADEVFARHGWQTDPYLCPEHAHNAAHAALSSPPSAPEKGEPMSEIQPQPQPPVPMQVAPKSPALAAFASFFVPGLGSLIIGRVGWGIGIFAAYVIAWLLALVVIGFVLVPLVWVWGMIDAYMGAQSWNRAHGIVS